MQQSATLTPHADNSNASIEVLKIRHLNNGGSLRAFVSIKIGHLILHSLRVIEQPGQKAWLALPKQEMKDASGETKYWPICEASKELKANIDQVVLPRWRAELDAAGRA